MNRKQTIIIIILFLGFSLSVLLGLVTDEEPTEYINPVVEQTCEPVTGDFHIYRGQCLPESYEPELVTLSPRASWLTTEQRLRPEAKEVFERMILDAEKEGMCITISSSYRSYFKQNELYNYEVDKDKVAKAGESEHQTGLAVDFVACPMENGVRNDNVERLELKNDFETLPEYKWLVKNAIHYNVYQSFREDNTEETGYPAESWHWKLILN